jgi:hypothetical protein|tara:strand:+ start:137 stop:400 length:264 start_codon:yes stop_codon:yes gene_type:complete
MNWILRTFDDLIFKQNRISKIRMATDSFVNSYGIEVEETVDGYNIQVLKNEMHYNKTHLVSRDLTSLTKSDVTKYMEVIQRFGRHSW